jgi:RNA recognition motif-containing protein
MSKKLFVANMPWGVNSAELLDLFSEFGEIISADVVFDKETGRSRGFGFVEFVLDEDAERAIKEMDGYVVGERSLRVNEAIAKEKKQNSSAFTQESREEDKE